MDADLPRTPVHPNLKGETTMLLTLTVLTGREYLYELPGVVPDDDHAICDHLDNAGWLRTRTHNPAGAASRVTHVHARGVVAWHR